MSGATAVRTPTTCSITETWTTRCARIRRSPPTGTKPGSRPASGSRSTAAQAGEPGPNQKPNRGGRAPERVRRVTLWGEWPMTMDVAAGGLRGTIAGEVILPADSGYDEARSTFNATIDRRPYAIVRPRTTADVVAAVRWARDTDLPIAVRGGGHSVAGHAVADAALVIDLRLMRKVVVDPARKQVRVQGGALWEDVDRATIPHGLATPGGTFGDTGVGGLTLGGGIGVLLGTAGLTCDNLIRAEVVTANGSVVIAGADGDLELLW